MVNESAISLNPNNPTLSLTFGTYRVSAETAAMEVTRALEAGIRSIDTAHLYKNEGAVFGAVRVFEAANPEAGPIRVCTKIFKNLIFDQTIRAVEISAERLGRTLDMVLLHRPLPSVMWRALNACVDRGLVKEIGVSNYSITRLKSLLAFCHGRDAPPCRYPALNQIELHPFVGPIWPLIGLCRSAGIRVQGHTVLAQGKYFDFPPLVRLAAKLGLSPAVVLLRWAQQLGAEVVFHTAREDHLQEIIQATARAPELSPRDMAEMSGYYALETHRFFPEPASPLLDDDELSDVVDTNRYVELVAARLDADRRAMERGLAVSDTALNLPANTNRQLLTDPIANQIALQLFPVEEGKTAEGSYSRFRDLIRKLRSSAHTLKATEPQPKALSCTLHLANRTVGPQRFVKGEPVSMAVAYPEAMPVEVAPAEELAPFFEFLRDPERLSPEASNSTEAPFVFTRGAYFPDERMDLCKQVVGPDHIGKLCAAVEQPFMAEQPPRWGRVRHFLLGNNIACEGDSIASAQAMARLMANPRAEIETWYLAGNSIGPEAMGILADGLAQNVHARALWLKRNALGTGGAAHLGRLLATNRTLHLLDVDNTGLFDEGIEALVRAFESAGGELHLQHLYASSNALSEQALLALRPLFTKALPLPCSFVSLSLSLNRFGNEGLDVFTDILETGALGNLERLDLGSIGLEAPDLSRFTTVLIRHCPKLRSLDFGTYLSTRDLGEKANRLDSDVTLLERLLREHPALELLDVSICGLPTGSLDRLVAACKKHQSLHGVRGNAVHHTEQERRFLKQPKRVLHIDSIYRGRA
jgi:diketogulonate reductase-like aldo/keto reductase